MFGRPPKERPFDWERLQRERKRADNADVATRWFWTWVWLTVLGMLAAYLNGRWHF